MTTTDRTLRAALYLRLSEDKRQTGDNVADQQRAGRKLAVSLGAQVVRVYDDNDHPASDPKRKPRPAFEQMLRDAEAGAFDILVIRHADRLYRTPYDQGRIAEVFGPRRIVIHQEWAGYPLDLSTPTGILNAGIMAQVAQYETHHKIERQKAHNRQRAARGEPPQGGPTPFGYARERSVSGSTMWVPKEPEAQTIRDAHLALLRGESLNSIARAWDASGLRPPRGGQWELTSVRRTLMRPLNAGLVLYEGAILPGVKGTWEPLVSEEEHYAVVAILSDPSRRTTPTKPRRHFLAGIATCSSCGKPMKSGWVGNRRGKNVQSPLYRCVRRECQKRLSVAELKLDAEVERRFLTERGHLGRYKLIPAAGHDAAALADVEARIKATSARLGMDLPDAEVDSLMARLSELKTERARIKDAPAFPNYEGGTVAEEWERLGTLSDKERLEGRRKLLLDHLEPGGLLISPRGKVSHRFDPTRVTIKWREVPELDAGAVEFGPDNGADFGDVPLSA